jgi:alkylation response protein AidB-like acyl-CoA dehydrogenase
MSEISAFLTIAHEELRAEVRSFAETVVAPRVATMEQTKEIDRELSRLIAEQGWIGATVDDTYGGMAAGHVAKTIIIEELSRVSGAMGAMAQASQLGVAKIIHFGNEQQKRTWLPRVADGTCLPTIAVTETASGGHVLGMRTTAERRDGGYVLNGHKVFVGNSHVGDLHGVVARTGEGSGGLSAFLVESERPGFSLAPYPETMGLHGFSFGELVFADCRVPAANMLGSPGDGLAVAYSSSVLYGRPNLAANPYRALRKHAVAVEFQRIQQRHVERACRVLDAQALVSTPDAIQPLQRMRYAYLRPVNACAFLHRLL